MKILDLIAARFARREAGRRERRAISAVADLDDRLRLDIGLPSRADAPRLPSRQARAGRLCPPQA